MFRLLSFAVTNHRSIKERQEITFLSSNLKTVTPKDGEGWDNYIHKALALFGANASGKTNMIDGLHYALTAIQTSSTRWRDLRAVPRACFKLESSKTVEPSIFEFEFVYNNIYYSYKFAVKDEGFLYEEGYYRPNKRLQKLLSRNYEKSPRRWLAVSEFIKHDRMEQPNPKEEKFAHALKALVDHVGLFPSGEEDVQKRLSGVAQGIVRNTLNLEDICMLLKIADLGIDEVAVEEEQVPPALVQRLRRAYAILNGEDEGAGSDSNDDLETVLKDTDADQLINRGLFFYHSSKEEKKIEFSLGEESRGTVTWLANIVPAVQILKQGGVYVIDELDSGLHPELLEAFIRIFTNDEINTNGAQLLFSCHNTQLLSPTSGAGLTEEQIWFAEKDSYGATSVYSLADYPKRKDANYMKRYLAGRYGALPNPTESLISSVLEDL